MDDKGKELQKRKYEDDENPEEITSEDTETDIQTASGPPKTKVSKVEHTTVDVTEESKKEDAEKYLPPVFLRCQPKAMKENVLYLISMKFIQKISAEVNDLGISIDDLDNSPTSLGMLLSKDLPQIPEFPVFTTSGDVKVNIVKCGSIMLSPAELLKIENCHQTIFKEMLYSTKEHPFSPSDSPMSFYVVPINKNLGSIDFAFITSVLDIQFKQIRRTFERPDTQDVFKMGVSWVPIYSTDLNRLSEALQQFTSNLSRKKVYREHLFREMCLTYSFPELFFAQLKIMPVAIFRSHSLLMAEEIRRTVSYSDDHETGYSELQWPYFSIEDAHVPADDIEKQSDNIVRFLNTNEYLSPSPSDIVQALTLRGIKDTFDLEKLEVMGDCFLKYAITVLLFHQFVRYDSAKLSNIRKKIVSNENLAQKAKSRNLIRYIITDSFSEAIMLPPCYKSTEKAVTSPKEGEYKKPRNSFSSEKIINLKTVADVTEALIGVYMLRLGQKGALDFMNSLNLFTLPETNESFYSSDWPPSARILPDEQISISEEDHLKLKQTEDVINYTFKCKHLIIQATRMTYRHQSVEFKFDRMSLLGDAIFDFLITRNLYEEKEISPGELHEKKVSIFNKDFRGCIAIKYKLHMFTQDKRIRQLVATFEESKPFIHFLEHGYLEDTDESLEIDLPRILSNILSAVVAAVYLDNQMDLTVTWSIICPMIQPAIEYLKKNAAAANPVIEVMQILRQLKREFVWCHEKQGDDVCVKIFLSDKKEVEARGKNITIAKRLAAVKARDELKKSNQ